LTATALDAGGALVLTDPANWFWSSDNPQVATVVPGGNPTAFVGVTAGSVNITATDRESGRSTTVAVGIADPVSVAISPATVTVPRDTRQQFTATVTGTTNTAVTWSIQEGDTGGDIDSTGNYQSPDNAGVYHVVATSVADPTQSAVATVTVPVEVFVSPQTVTLPRVVGNTVVRQQQFTASVAGTNNQAVFWTVRAPLPPEQAAGGTIDNNGLYTAPNNTSEADRVDIVVATSQTDPTRSGTATVNNPGVQIN
jgi:hypothetical protein